MEQNTEKIGNIVLLGTSHISPDSIKTIEDLFLDSLDIVCLELDKQRFYGLLNPQKQKIKLRDIRRVGITGFFFLLIGKWAESAMGKIVGTKPGDEMLRATKLAKEKGVKIALIDQQMAVTLSRLSKRITWKEKGRFFLDILMGPFSKKRKHFNLASVPNEELLATLLLEVEKKYPSVYKTLVSERNEVMAKRIISINNTYPDKKILVIVGAGHVKGMKKILERDLDKVKV